MKRKARDEGYSEGYNAAFGKWMRDEVGFIDKIQWELVESFKKQIEIDLMA